MRDIVFTAQAWSDFIEWSKSDRKIFEKISTLIEETSRTPFKGTGKPEPLRYQLSGYWSRRISEEHRFVYTVHAKKFKLYPANTIIPIKHRPY